jgi:hypothetical protein
MLSFTEIKPQRVRKMESKLMAPIRITGNQREWLEKERVRTGNSYSVIIRNLIQDKLTEAGSK